MASCRCWRRCRLSPAGSRSRSTHDLPTAGVKGILLGGAFDLARQGGGFRCGQRGAAAALAAAAAQRVCSRSARPAARYGSLATRPHAVPYDDFASEVASATSSSARLVTGAVRRTCSAGRGGGDAGRSCCRHLDDMALLRARVPPTGGTDLRGGAGSISAHQHAWRGAADLVAGYLCGDPERGGPSGLCDGADTLPWCAGSRGARQAAAPAGQT